MNGGSCRPWVHDVSQFQTRLRTCVCRRGRDAAVGDVDWLSREVVSTLEYDHRPTWPLGVGSHGREVATQPDKYRDIERGVDAVGDEIRGVRLPNGAEIELKAGGHPDACSHRIDLQAAPVASNDSPYEGGLVRTVGLRGGLRRGLRVAGEAMLLDESSDRRIDETVALSRGSHSHHNHVQEELTDREPLPLEPIESGELAVGLEPARGASDVVDDGVRDHAGSWKGLRNTHGQVGAAGPDLPRLM